MAGSTRAALALLIVLSATALLMAGRVDGQIWADVCKFVFGAYAVARTVTHNAELKQPK